MSFNWKQLDVSQNPPFYVDADDVIYYAREYISQGGYAASEANQLIHNLKKDPLRKGKPDWRYKRLAIEQFAAELARALKDGVLIVPIPSSKTPSDPEYDGRMDDVVAEVARIKPTIRVERPFGIARSTVPVHAGGERHPDEIYANLTWHGLVNPSKPIILVDDVITTGGHFKACQRMIGVHHPTHQVCGVFWAKTVWRDVV